MTAQYGLVRLRSLNTDPGPVGILTDNPNNFNCYDDQGNPGQPEYLGKQRDDCRRQRNQRQRAGILFLRQPDPIPGTNGTLTNQDYFYGQTSYKSSDKFTAFAAFRYQSERGYTAYDYFQQQPTAATTTPSCRPPGTWRNRLYYSAGADLPNYSVFGFQPTPHATAAYYFSKPTAAGLLSGTKLRFNYSQGILEPTIAEQNGFHLRRVEFAAERPAIDRATRDYPGRRAANEDVRSRCRPAHVWNPGAIARRVLSQRLSPIRLSLWMPRRCCNLAFHRRWNRLSPILPTGPTSTPSASTPRGSRPVQNIASRIDCSSAVDTRC